jgi:hypothetical protein
MKKYNGLSVEQSGESWKYLRESYPNTKPENLDLKITQGLKRFAQKMGKILDESIYTLNLKQVAESLDVAYDFMILMIFGRYSQELGSSLAGLVIIGTGDCENCGCDGLEFFDYDQELGETTFECPYCKTKQFSPRE